MSSRRKVQGWRELRCVDRRCGYSQAIDYASVLPDRLRSSLGEEAVRDDESHSAKQPTQHP